MAHPRARIGVHGGTFDPVHIGHLVAAVNVRADLHLDRVLLVVANSPWQKVGRQEISPAADRFAMVAAAVEGIDGLEACDLEIRRGGDSVTADTLADLRRIHGDEAELFLVLGGDVARQLPTWRRVDEVRAGCTLAVVDRAGHPADMEALWADGWRAERVTIPALEVSATDIRDRVCAGRPIDVLVPPEAIRLIHERGLYAATR